MCKVLKYNYTLIYLLSVRLLIWRVKLMRISGKRFPRWFREHLESSVRRTGMPISFEKEQKLNYQIIISNSISISSTFYRICSEPYNPSAPLLSTYLCVNATLTEKVWCVMSIVWVRRFCNMTQIVWVAASIFLRNTEPKKRAKTLVM